MSARWPADEPKPRMPAVNHGLSGVQVVALIAVLVSFAAVAGLALNLL